MEKLTEGEEGGYNFEVIIDTLKRMNACGAKATDTEPMTLSMGEFIDLYQEYKNLFDQENMLRAGRTTYAEVEKKATEREIIVEF